MPISCTDFGDLYRCNLDPLKQTTLDRIKLKLEFCFNHTDVSGNDTLVLSDTNSASLWKNLLVSLLIPLLDDSRWVFFVQYSFHVLPFLLALHCFCSACETLVPVAWGEGIENPRIHECPLHRLPEASNHYVRVQLFCACQRATLLCLLSKAATAFPSRHPYRHLKADQQWCWVGHCASCG